VRRVKNTVEENSKSWIWAYLSKFAISFQSLLQSPDALARSGLATSVDRTPHLNCSSYVYLAGQQHIPLVYCHKKGF
jgi:hypothetical protein